ncbi:Conserved hypothetical protein [gamma proteobacterium HdN1]|nr:Conserved hypothetical protein [gamma proteobacterium HdN1]
MTEVAAEYHAGQTVVAGMKPHPWRQALYDELHSRPSPVIRSACKVLHFSLLLPQSEDVLTPLTRLCSLFDLPRPANASCLYQDFGPFELRFERHSEFANFTFIFPAEIPVMLDGLALLPRGWLASLPGELVAATQLVFVQEEPDRNQWQEWFEGQRVAGASVAEQKARVWTAFKLHSDGFGRMLVHNQGLSAYQSGRLVQRLLELETYRLMSLLALPMARKIGQDLRQIEDKLAALNQKISDIGQDADERALLHEVSELAADVEHRRSATNFRFSAAVAYHDLVNDRLNQIREEPLEGMQSLREFLQRRLTPGIKTVRAVRIRLEGISSRIAHTASLLQTRVDLSIQEQNQHLLSSMNRRSQLQLRLQQTVEGLSVAAISYYLVGLLNYIFKAMNQVGLNVDASIASGIAAPLVAAMAYFGIYRLKARITRRLG